MSRELSTDPVERRRQTAQPLDVDDSSPHRRECEIELQLGEQHVSWHTITRAEYYERTS